ncbi:DgyrCDS3189 [Dimorphilus gyrociliatus]|uniref:DgyrCDS3189 n=1 Tax=Dimorphilus gyrociliatus TaxID=2664684 RepID=A0A7I8VEC3_9ANNE|nr:DgyrCDS3189 [Dimorphilus gyrociliatus]
MKLEHHLLITIQLVVVYLSFSFCYISIEDNIATNRPAYQQVTAVKNNNASRALMDAIFKTAKSIVDYSNRPWWAVDLQGLYTITEVCVINGDSASNLDMFEVYTETKLLIGGQLCFQQTSLIPQQAANNPENFFCKNCSCTGRFLRVQKININILAISIIRIRGTFIKEDDNVIFQMATSKVFLYTNENDILISKLYDENFSSFLKSSTLQNVGAFLRIDMLNLYQIETIVMTRARGISSVASHIEVFLNDISDSLESPQCKLISEVQVSTELIWETFVIHNNKSLIGRYVLFRPHSTSYGSGSNFISTSEVVIYNRNITNTTLMNDVKIEKSHGIYSFYKNNVQISGTFSISLTKDDELTLNINVDYIDTICVTYTTATVQKGKEIKACVFSGNDIEICFNLSVITRRAQTVCDSFQQLNITKISLLANQDIIIKDIDIFGLQFTNISDRNSSGIYSIPRKNKENQFIY